MPSLGSQKNLHMYVKQEQPQQTIQVYMQMRAAMMEPGEHVFVSASGQQVHHDLLTNSVGLNPFTCSSLVDTYAEARKVCEGLGKKNVIGWNAMIAGYTKEGIWTLKP